MTTTERRNTLSNDFFSDLAKDLYGTRRLWELARERYEDFVADNPDVAPHVLDGALVSQEEFEDLTAPYEIKGVTLNGAALFISPTTFGYE